MEHTKGEWKAAFNPGVTGPTTPSHFPICGGRDWPYRTINVGTETIAIIPAQDRNKEHIPDEDVMLANAHLIAAAPDLYEVLSTIQLQIENGVLDIGDARVERDIRKALAKARVES